MALLDLVGRRWALRILWELHAVEQPVTFRELRQQCDDMSSSLLTRRLHELGESGLVERTKSGYALTGQGHRLVAHLQPLSAWSESWAAALAEPPT
ncbi:winged helix-turn-helix transcriptional regulator [Nocardia sp. X0981]